MGDVVLRKAGDKVAADLRMIQVSSDAKFDRSILTGESLPVAAAETMTETNYMETRQSEAAALLRLAAADLGFPLLARQATSLLPARSARKERLLALSSAVGTTPSLAALPRRPADRVRCARRCRWRSLALSASVRRFGTPRVPST